MKRIALLISLFALSTAASCTNKRLSGDNTPTADQKPAASAAVDKPEKRESKPTKKAEAPQKKTIPAPEDVAAPPEGAEKSATGLAWTIIEPGSGGAKPVKADRVEVHYTGWTTDGKMFDSSVAQNKPASFGVAQVIKGWTEGLQLMTVGEKRRFWIPGNLAYGDKPRPGAPAGALTFDVKLLKIMSAPTTPKDVAAAPKGAKKTASGLQYIVIREGTGDKPTPKNRVEVHYSGWTKDGKMFDTSFKRGKPLTFGVTQVIKGWTEGLQLMKAGAKYRFWIPGDLAYGDKPRRPGSPSGQLTFDVELLKVL